MSALYYFNGLPVHYNQKSVILVD